MAEFASWITQSVITLEADKTVYEAAVLMKERRVGSVLITENGQPKGKLIGIFTERDVLNKVVAADRPPRTTRLAEVMTHNPKSMTLEDDYREMLHAMDEGGFRHVPIVDEQGGAIGVVSIRNLMKLVEARSMVETSLDLTW